VRSVAVNQKSIQEESRYRNILHLEKTITTLLKTHKLIDKFVLFKPNECSSEFIVTTIFLQLTAAFKSCFVYNPCQHLIYSPNIQLKGLWLQHILNIQ
jgi:hypothetical protein